MKNIDDRELDAIIKQSLERKQVLDAINRSVMRRIKRKRRIQWVRLVAFSFGFPVVMALLGLVYYALFRHFADNPIVMYSLVLPVVTMLIVGGKVLSDFSIRRV